MSFNKLILSIVFGISLYGTTTSMEREDTFEGQWQNVAGDMSRQPHYYINDFIKNNNPEHMKSLGLWLTQKRKDISKTDEWDDTITDLMDCVSICRCNCIEKAKIIAVCNAIEKIAQELQPGQDCSQLLIERAQNAVTKTANESIETQTKKDLYSF